MRRISIIALSIAVLLAAACGLSLWWAFGASWLTPAWDVHVCCFDGELILARYECGTGSWHAPLSHWNCIHVTPEWRQSRAALFRHGTVSWPLGWLALGAMGVSALLWLYADEPVSSDRDNPPDRPAASTCSRG